MPLHKTRWMRLTSIHLDHWYTEHVHSHEYLIDHRLLSLWSSPSSLSPTASNIVQMTIPEVVVMMMMMMMMMVLVVTCSLWNTFLYQYSSISSIITLWIITAHWPRKTHYHKLTWQTNNAIAHDNNTRDKTQWQLTRGFTHSHSNVFIETHITKEHKRS